MLLCLFVFISCTSDDDDDDSLSGTLLSISVDATEAKTEYTAGEKFSTKEIIITSGWSSNNYSQPNWTKLISDSESGLTYSAKINNENVVLENDKTVLSTAGKYTVTVTYKAGKVSAKSTYTIVVNEIETDSISYKMAGTIAKNANIPAISAVNESTGISLNFWLGNNIKSDSELFSSGNASLKAPAAYVGESCYATVSFNKDKSVTYYKNGELKLTSPATDSTNQFSAFISGVATSGISLNSQGISMTNVIVSAAKNSTEARKVYNEAISSITKLNASNLMLKQGEKYDVNAIQLTASDDNAIWDIAISATKVAGDAVDTSIDATYYVTFSLGNLLTTSTITVGTVEVPEAYWYDALKDASAEGVSIVGSGSFVSDETFGTVFKNESGTTTRSNYLLLPSDIMACASSTNEITIGFWVRDTTGDTYLYHPLFACYAASPKSLATSENTYEEGVNTTCNTFPMAIAQTRGLLQVNCDGWSDYTDKQNDSGKNAESIDYLSDKGWHYYTAVFTVTTASVYIDGNLVNSWTIDGTSEGQNMSGLFSSGKKLTYNCLGGNQAWGWNDKDSPYSYAKFSIWNKALTKDQISAVASTTKKAD